MAWVRDMDVLNLAIEIAVAAHAGQVDRGGHPYIIHPLRVMSRLEDMEDRIIAVLHDVVEDTYVTLDSLRARGFSNNIVNGVDSVTRREGESRKDYLERVANHPNGRRVKLVDLSENMNLDRIPNPTDKDRERVELYRKEMAYLINAGR